MTGEIQILNNNFFELIQKLVEKAVDEKLENLKPTTHLLKKFMSLEEAAEYLNLSRNTLYMYNSKNVIPFHRTGNRVYYKLEDLDQYVLGSKQTKSLQERKAEFLTANSNKSIRREKRK